MASSPEGSLLRSVGVEKPQSPASMEMKMKIFVQVGSCIAQKENQICKFFARS
jgi:hypothetical protein